MHGRRLALVDLLHIADRLFGHAKGDERASRMGLGVRQGSKQEMLGAYV